MKVTCKTESIIAQPLSKLLNKPGLYKSTETWGGRDYVYLLIHDPDDCEGDSVYLYDNTDGEREECYEHIMAISPASTGATISSVVIVNGFPGLLFMPVSSITLTA